MAKRKKEPAPLAKDPRVQELVSCLLFALNSFRNKPVFDQRTKSMDSWHRWFKRALAEAGFEVREAGEQALAPPAADARG